MDVATIQKHLDQVNGHVETGERHLARQKEIIASLSGRDREMAEAILETFEQSQSMHLEHQESLRTQLARARKRASEEARR